MKEVRTGYSCSVFYALTHSLRVACVALLDTVIQKTLISHQRCMCTYSVIPSKNHSYYSVSSSSICKHQKCFFIFQRPVHMINSWIFLRWKCYFMPLVWAAMHGMWKYTFLDSVIHFPSSTNRLYLALSNGKIFLTFKSTLWSWTGTTELELIAWTLKCKSDFTCRIIASSMWSITWCHMMGPPLYSVLRLSRLWLKRSRKSLSLLCFLSWYD